MTKKAFTLIELLVVIAIIAMLLAILIPSLSAIKEYASVVNCLSNQKNIALAYIMYTADNDDKFSSGYVYDNLNPSNATPSWVKAPLLYDAAGEDRYDGDTHVQGAASFWMGLLIDEGGRDIYNAALYAQGFGFVEGFSVNPRRN